MKLNYEDKKRYLVALNDTCVVDTCFNACKVNDLYYPINDDCIMDLDSAYKLANELGGTVFEITFTEVK